MISGAVILPKTYDSVREYLSRRVLRLVFPFLFWSLPYLIWQFMLMRDNGALEGMDFVGVLKTIVLSYRDGVWYHFWYIYLIIGLNLFFPILGRWIKNSSVSEIRYFLIIWLITIFATLPFIELVFPRVELAYFAGYIGYPVLGYYLMTLPVHNRRTVISISAVLLVIGSIVTIGGTHMISHSRGALFLGLLGNLNPIVIMMGVSAFVLFKHLKLDNPNRVFQSGVRFLGKYSYGIYLVHVAVLGLLERIGIYHSFVDPALGIPLTAVLCYSLSALIVWGVNKLPFGKYISG
jgi:surface polysaccharide O-acyltransferase-like enzyme